MSSKRVRRFVPITVSLSLICILIGYAPWGEVETAFDKLEISSVVILVSLSLLYYALKSLRFWYLLQAIGIRQPLGLVSASYISAQPVSLLPGGEIFRSHALRRYAGVPVHKSISQFTAQGLLEGAAMALLMLISALALQRLRLPAIILTTLVLGLAVAIRRGHLARAGRVINKLPRVDLKDEQIESFSYHNRIIFSRKWLPLLYGLSILVELVGAVISYVSVAGLGGHINFFQAILLYIVPVIMGFVSFLPGGFGVSEQSAIGVLLLSKISVGLAVAATLVMRVAIVIMGVLYGVIALLFLQTKKVR